MTTKISSPPAASRGAWPRDEVDDPPPTPGGIISALLKGDERATKWLDDGSRLPDAIIALAREAGVTDDLGRCFASARELADFALARVPMRSLAGSSVHVARCDSCRRVFEQVSGKRSAVIDRWLATARQWDTTGYPDDAIGAAHEILAPLDDVEEWAREALAGSPVVKNRSVPAAHTQQLLEGRPRRSRRFAAVGAVMAAASMAALVLFLQRPPSKSTTVGCSKDTDCKRDSSCVNGICQSRPIATAEPVCRLDGDCSRGSACVKGACVPARDIEAGPSSALRTLATVVPPPGNRNGVVRDQPNIWARRVTELPRGTAVVILGSSGDGLWRRVRWTVDGVADEGWMHHDLLRDGVRAPQLGPEAPCRADDTDTQCSTDLFVQLLTATPSTPPEYDYPDVRAMFANQSDLAGVRIVEATRNGMRTVLAMVRNRCQADRILALANERLKTGATARCEELGATRPIATLR